MTVTRQILEFIHEELELSINRDDVIAYTETMTFTLILMATNIDL